MFAPEDIETRPLTLTRDTSKTLISRGFKTIVGYQNPISNIKAMQFHKPDPDMFLMGHPSRRLHHVANMTIYDRVFKPISGVNSPWVHLRLPSFYVKAGARSALAASQF